MAHVLHSRSAGSPPSTTCSEPPYFEVECNPHHQRGLAAAKMLSRQAALSARDAANEANHLAAHHSKSRHAPDFAQRRGSRGGTGDFNLDLLADHPIWAELGVPYPGSEGQSSTDTGRPIPSGASTPVAAIPVEEDAMVEELDLLANSQLHIATHQDPPLYRTKDGVTLNGEQSRLVDLILGGRNVFYTGPAGCGKSSVLEVFVTELRKRDKNVDIVAPTGIAALNVEGTTTWSYMGWIPDDDRRPLYEMKAKTKGQPGVAERLLLTNVLVIDEISMLDSNFFYRMSEVMKFVRKSFEPFGGVQVVVTGDFLQLPPVKPFKYCAECGRDLKRDDKRDILTCIEDDDRNDDSEPSPKPCPNPRSYFGADKWAFRSSTWEECGFEYRHLNTVHRQSQAGFRDLLKKCREVDSINEREYNRLKTEEYVYRCVDDISGLNHKLKRHQRLLGLARMEATLGDKDHQTLYEFREHRYDKKVYLREGMRVCLLANISLADQLVNGSQGEICGFQQITFGNTPRLPRQGENQSLDRPLLFGDLAKYRESEIRRFIHGLEKPLWPVVQFDNGTRLTVAADCRVAQRGPHSCPSEVLLSRTQIPLMPAWALTVHKAQGMTLDRVIINMKRAFEEGQVYVALSRVRTLEGLKVDGDVRALSERIVANKEAKHFYKTVFGVQDGWGIGRAGIGRLPE
ncbi:hypothetical protein RB595_000296 [Gaeumannomyces hyphopodioides]